MKVGDGSTRLWVKVPPPPPAPTDTTTSEAATSSAVMIKVEGLVKTEVVEMSSSSHANGQGMDGNDKEGEESDGSLSKRARKLEVGEETVGRLMTSDITDLKG